MPAHWRDLAACKGEPVQVFFPTDVCIHPADERDNHICKICRRAREDDYHLAKSICADCPVRKECLDHALHSEDGYHGVWGGTTPRERKIMRRRRRLGDIITIDITYQTVLDIAL